jgi:hypothetical protein
MLLSLLSIIYIFTFTLHVLGAPTSSTHPKRLVVRIGPDLKTLTPHIFNNELPHFIDSPYFIGRIHVRVRNGSSDPSPYFSGKGRKFSIRVQGRFKQVSIPIFSYLLFMFFILLTFFY